MKIVLIVEGQTERVFLPHLRKFLEARLGNSMPRIVPHLEDGRIPTRDKLRRVVSNLLSGPRAADHVIALTDVYTGMQPPEFVDAADAKAKMREWVGNEPRFHPHAAQHDFEAWLLPFWPSIQRLAGHNKACPSGNPESVNHNNPPAYRIKEIFQIGQRRGSYVKTRDAARILRDNDLAISVARCPELRALVNTILHACGGEVIP